MFDPIIILGRTRSSPQAVPSMRVLGSMLGLAALDRGWAFGPSSTRLSRIFLLLKETWSVLAPLHGRLLQIAVHQKIFEVVSDESTLQPSGLIHARELALALQLSFQDLYIPGFLEISLVETCLGFWHSLGLKPCPSYGSYLPSPVHCTMCGMVLRKDMLGPSTLAWRIHR